jgi:two-component system chemotaxis sensor kinase CheA
LAAEPLDMVETRASIDQITLRQKGIAGSAVIGGKTTLILDLFELAEGRVPEAAALGPAMAVADSAGRQTTVLVAEDSDFFRGQIQRLVEAVGYRVLAAEDGEAAWELLGQHAGEVDAVATDIEMPRLDGLGLTRRIRTDSRFAGLPVIALSSLAGEEEVARGLAAGVNEYLIKLNQDDLVTCLQRMLRDRSGVGEAR